MSQEEIDLSLKIAVDVNFFSHRMFNYEFEYNCIFS